MSTHAMRMLIVYLLGLVLGLAIALSLSDPPPAFTCAFGNHGGAQ